MGKELLLEIGTEEIPAAFLPGAIEELKELCKKTFQDVRLTFESIETFGTPRRLVLCVEGLSEQQEELNQKVLGPARSVAFDDQGNPTKAAVGFARGQGVPVEELAIEETPKGDYVCAVKKEAGLPTAEILQNRLPQIITSLHFPKSMRWGSGTLRFARPIHWLLALYQEEVIPMEVDGVKSGNLSRGHRFMSPGSFTVYGIKSYKTLTREHGLLFDPNDRKAEILKQISAIEKEIGGHIVLDEDLLEEVVNLVEMPTALCGSFEPGFLSLPRQVLVTSMREHQRYFSVEDKKGDLMPHFVTISDTRSKDNRMIIAGNERVLRARLTDALYFYKTDCKRPISSYAEDLRKVTFQDKLGTYHEKVGRIEALTRWLVEQAGVGDPDTASRAAALCKADLCTEMVGEFPALQGVMGRAYALLSGESEKVARAIEEHYRPRFAGDDLPVTIEGAMVSIADKLDTLAGCFGIGLVPSGSVDPYALRRQTIGILAILTEKGYDLSLNEMMGQALRQLNGKIDRDSNETAGELRTYFKGRLSGMLTADGHRYDTVEAALAAGFDHLPDTINRVKALSSFRKDEMFEPFTVVCKRAMNIIKENKDDTVEHGVLAHETEKQLYDEIQQAEGAVQGLVAQGNYGEALSKIASLRGTIDAFFDAVMVMDEDPGVRRNRLALLTRISSLVSQIADFSKIVVE